MIRAASFTFACLASVGQGRGTSKPLSSAFSDHHDRSPRSTSIHEVDQAVLSTLERLAMTLLASVPATAGRLSSLADASLVEHPLPQPRRHVVAMSDEPNPSSPGRRMLTSSAGMAAVSALLPTSPLSPSVAHAKELASGSGAIVNKDPESLLRYGLPAQPKDVVKVQQQLEDADRNFQKFLSIQAEGNLRTAQGKLKSSEIMKAVPAASKSEAETLLAAIDADIVKAADEQTTAPVKDALKKLTTVQEMIASTYSQPVPPAEYIKDRPWLKGRATVAMTIERPGGQKFDIQNNLYDKVDITMVVDGYTAPITAGNFVDLVQRGFYNGFTIQRSDGFVVQTGDPSGTGSPIPQPASQNGFVPPGSDAVRRIPLEVFVQGDKGPIYNTNFDDDGRGGYAAVLPFNAYGAMGMAISEGEYDSGSSQFFWLLFDSDLTPGGKNLLDGRYACFGYTVGNPELLGGVQEGDKITSAKVISGIENLVQPS
mmetsp:Transcript_10880/g.17979  ORF Transcript_10880/g.17979 Transcript_10880/m.17979 type:complete len:484 (-) Transcript_10880:92-1543(-)